MPIISHHTSVSPQNNTFGLRLSPYSTFLPSDVRIMAEHPLDIHVLTHIAHFCRRMSESWPNIR
ncbi:Uncharacterized protein APZ42_031195 [Daphnia magna]|uniref:Uncharacterized protein n=1 Tax=Daphnia magna TaxID=35525 RepID=A0A164N2H3_9CRUS|nr:Uncharacterized protein APZ42_031195 [Daphnia magna]